MVIGKMLIKINARRKAMFKIIKGFFLNIIFKNKFQF